jgi:AcrR family transcriptional regulator
MTDERKPPGRKAADRVTVPPPAGGRQRLMRAALELAATTRSLATLGLREVARHAGLNPNTFYRHFRDFDELGVTMLAELGEELRAGLRERRLRPAQEGLRVDPMADPAEALLAAQSIVRESVTLVLDFVTEHEQVYIVGIRELFGASPVLRQAMRRLLAEIARDMTEDFRRLIPLPGLSETALAGIARHIVRQMVFFSMDYLENPDRRAAVREEAEAFILLLFTGLLARQAPGFPSNLLRPR